MLIWGKTLKYYRAWRDTCYLLSALLNCSTECIMPNLLNNQAKCNFAYKQVCPQKVFYMPYSDDGLFELLGCLTGPEGLERITLACSDPGNAYINCCRWFQCSDAFKY